jgi:hypothetical protein
MRSIPICFCDRKVIAASKKYQSHYQDWGKSSRHVFAMVHHGLRETDAVMPWAHAYHGRCNVHNEEEVLTVVHLIDWPAFALSHRKQASLREQFGIQCMRSSSSFSCTVKPLSIVLCIVWVHHCLHIYQCNYSHQGLWMNDASTVSWTQPKHHVSVCGVYSVHCKTETYTLKKSRKCNINHIHIYTTFYQLLDNKILTCTHQIDGKILLYLEFSTYFVI